MAKFKVSVLKDILKEKTEDGTLKYSQGRVYLFVSIVIYYLTIGVITVKSLRPDVDISMEPLKVIIEALQYALLLFGGYVFGGKFVDVAKIVFGNKTGEE